MDFLEISNIEILHRPELQFEIELLNRLPEPVRLHNEMLDRMNFQRTFIFKNGEAI